MDSMKKGIVEYYDAVAKVYNIQHGVGLYGREWGLKNYYMGLFNKYITKNKDKDILEIGCGTGKYTEIFKTFTDSLTAIDISSGMIDEAKKINPEVDFYIGDCEELSDFEDSSFDIVVGIYTFAYYPNKLKALNSIKRVLRPGGIFFNLDMNGLSPIYAYTAYKKTNNMDIWHKYIKENTLKNLSKLYDNAGFTIIHKNNINWVPHTLSKKYVNLCSPIDKIFSKIPIIRQYALRIVIIAKKPEDK